MPDQWMRTPELCTRLHISRPTLYRLRLQRVLLPGQHFRRCGVSDLGPLVWDCSAVDLTLRAICWG